MANYRVNVGNVYERLTRNGNLINKTKITIKDVTEDGVIGVTASKKEIRASIEDVKTWKLLTYVKKATKAVRKRLNELSCVEVAIETIIAHNCGMSAKAIVEAMKTEGTFKFSETAKTPENSVSSRLNSYINTEENPKVKHISNNGKRNGIFYPADYELPTEIATAEAVTAEA